MIKGVKNMDKLASLKNESLAQQKLFQDKNSPDLNWSDPVLDSKNLVSTFEGINHKGFVVKRIEVYPFENLNGKTTYVVKETEVTPA